MAVQWLRLCAPNAGGMGSIPGRGTKILHSAARATPTLPQKKKEKEMATAYLGLTVCPKLFF